MFLPLRKYIRIHKTFSLRSAQLLSKGRPIFSQKDLKNISFDCIQTNDQSENIDAKFVRGCSENITTGPDLIRGSHP